MRKCHYECMYFSSYSSKAVHFHPAHMILQSVHQVIEIVWYIYLYLPPKSSKFLFPGIQILISRYFPPSREFLLFPGKLPTLFFIYHELKHNCRKYYVCNEPIWQITLYTFFFITDCSHMADRKSCA